MRQERDRKFSCGLRGDHGVRGHHGVSARHVVPWSSRGSLLKVRDSKAFFQEVKSRHENSIPTTDCLDPGDHGVAGDCGHGSLASSANPRSTTAGCPDSGTGRSCQRDWGNCASEGRRASDRGGVFDVQRGQGSCRAANPAHPGCSVQGG